MVKPYIKEGYYLPPHNIVLAKDITSDRREVGEAVSQTKLTDIGGSNCNPAIRYPPSPLTIGIPEVHRHPTLGYYQLAGKPSVHECPFTTFLAAYLDLDGYVREPGAG